MYGDPPLGFNLDIFPVNCLQSSHIQEPFQKFSFLSIPSKNLIINEFREYMNKLFFESKIGEGLISKGIFGKNVESRNELILKHQEEKYWLIKICILI